MSEIKFGRYKDEPQNEKQIYHTQSVCSKIIDFKNGRISHPENFDIKQISTELNNEIMTIILRLCKKIYDVDFHVENVELRDFVRYPSCPEFSKIEKKLIIFVTLIFAMI